MPDSKSTPVTAADAARRTVVLQCVIAASQGVSREDVIEWLANESLTSELSPLEQQFLHDDAPSRKENFRMSWMAEAQYYPDGYLV